MDVMAHTSSAIAVQQKQQTKREMEHNEQNIRYRVVLKTQSPGLTKCETWLQQALDRTSPPSSRIAAIENLARECREYQIFQNLRWLVENINDDENVRRALVRVLPNWGDGPELVGSLIRCLSIPGIRDEAVKALDSMAPVTSQREARLLDELARLRAGGWGYIQIAALPKL